AGGRAGSAAGRGRTSPRAARGSALPGRGPGRPARARSGARPVITMQRLIRRLRSILDGRVQAWLMRRQGMDGDPLRLERRRIYILPTGLGLAYAAMVFAM